MRCYMGIDIGTSASKGVLVDVHGKIIAQHSCAHGMEMPQPNYYEHDAEEVWWKEFCEISRQLIHKAGISPDEVRGVGASTLGADCLPVDEECKPLRKAILYGIDARAQDELKEITEVIGEEKLLEMRSTPLCSEDVFAKMLWVKNKEPEVYAKTYKFCTGSTYITAKLCGRYVLDNYLAQLCFFPAYDGSGNIREEYVAPFINPSQMAETAACTEVVGYVTEKAARETGLKAGTPVITGTDDAAAEAFSAGIVKVGDAMIMLGSSMYMICLTNGPIGDPRLWNAGYLIPGMHSVQGATNNMGTVTKWMRDNLFFDALDAERAGGANAYESMLKAGAAVPPGSEGLLALPYFAGERTPINDPDAVGVLFGLRLSHGRAHIYRAMLEGIAYGIAQHMEILKQNNMPVRNIVAIGGGIKNPLLLQIIADATGETIHTPAVTAGASYGDAILAAIGCGEYASFEEAKAIFRHGATYTPDPAAHAVYREGLKRFTTLYESTKTQTK